MSQRFVPVPTPETRTYWEKAAEGELWLPRCGSCGKVVFYPRGLCPDCDSADITWFRASGRGVVESFVINHIPAPGYEQDAPYIIALVMLEEGARLTSNLLGMVQEPEAVRIGMPVEVVFEQPYGMSGTFSGFTLPVMAYLNQYGLFPDDLAEVPVAQSEWAAGNPRAYRGKPLDLNAVLDSRMIAWPFRVLECCPLTDGGGALVVMSAERAADLDLAFPAVTVLGSGESCEGAGVTWMADLTSFAGFRESSASAFRESGRARSDIDHLMIYDAYAHVPLYGLEDLGFVGRGEAVPFIRGGATRPGGSLPMNTNGGGLLYTHTGMYGMFAIQEAVRQLRGDAFAPVPDVRTSFVPGIGGMFGAAGSLILSTS